MQPLVKLNIFTQEEIDALQRVNEPAITMQKKKDETPEKYRNSIHLQKQQKC